MTEKTFQRKAKRSAKTSAPTTRRTAPSAAGRIDTRGAAFYTARPAYALPTTAAVQRREQNEQATLQVAPAGSGPAPAAGAIVNPGAGEALNPAARRTLETGMGRDFGDVRVHGDPSAHRLARDFGARAFTHRNHIWLGPGESQHDLRLMAHEATHVVQQRARGAGIAVQRAPKKTTASCDTSPAGPDIQGNEIVVPTLRMPGFRNKNKVQNPLQKIEERGDQRSKWIKGVAQPLDTAVANRLQNEKPVTQNGKPSYYFKVGATGGFLFGSPAQIVAASAIPYWNDAGIKQAFDVDHEQELQVGGADAYNNMELLSSSSNRSSGAKIKNELRARVKETIVCLEQQGKASGLPKEPSALIKQGKRLRFRQVTSGLKVKGDGEPHWDRKQIEGGAHLKQLKPLTTKEIDKLREDATKLKLFQTPSGGAPVTITWDKNKKEAGFTDGHFLPGFKPSKVTFDVDAGTGTISGKYPGKPRKTKKGIIPAQDVVWKLVGLPGLHYAAYVDQSSVLSPLRILKAQGLSPVEIHQAFVDPVRGIVASGILKPTLGVFEDVAIDLSIDSGEVTFSKTFVAADFAIPGPVKLTGSTLTVAAGTAGLSAEGQVDFEIPEVAKGYLGAKIGTADGLELNGQIDFDAELFKPATVKLWYRDKLGGSGKLGIPRGAVKGVKSALLTVTVDGNRWEATGSVEPEIPGIDKGEMAAKFDPDKGLEIAGKLMFSEKIPAIKSGSIEAVIHQSEAGYRVKASGKADLDIPGVAATVEALYDDGGMLIKGSVGYKTRLVEGKITAGAANMPVDKEGNPAGPPGDGELAAFGKGEVTLTFAPWLQGKIGLELTPEGEIKVSGEVSLPSALEVFPEKKVEKKIFSIGVDIPIIGVAVAGQRIGIFATISGSLTARAGVGPGTLEDLSLGVVYNPMREEDTRVSGRAKFVVPAHAGLRLAVRGGLGAGIPIVSAQLGLEVGGELGIEGKAEASAQVDWSPARGVELDAKLDISAEPKFKFDLSGYASVEADLLFTTVDLYSARWQFASLELGSGLKFGITFPVKYREGQPFDISLDDVKFTIPDIDTMAMLKNLIKQIA